MQRAWNGCPNTSNPIHICTQYCVDRYGYNFVLSQLITKTRFNSFFSAQLRRLARNDSTLTAFVRYHDEMKDIYADVDDIIDDIGAAAIAQALASNSSLTKLDLSSNRLGNIGAASIAQALSFNSSLTTLDLRSNRLGNLGAASISQALSSNSTLTELNLYSNEIGNKGATAIAEAISINCSLTTLDLEDNQIGDTGAASIAQALSTNFTFTTLDLYNNEIQAPTLTEIELLFT